MAYVQVARRNKEAENEIKNWQKSFSKLFQQQNESENHQKLIFDNLSRHYPLSAYYYPFTISGNNLMKKSSHFFSHT